MKNSTASVLIIFNIITLFLLIFLITEKADINHSHDTSHSHYGYSESYHSHDAEEVKFGIYDDAESKVEELEKKIENLEDKIEKLQNDILFMSLELYR